MDRRMLEKFSMSLLAVVAITATASAQELQTAKAVSEATVEQEGRRALRESYLEERRKATEPTFDRAKALVQAVEERDAAQRAVAGAGSIYTPEWVPFGPAPINGGQTPTSNPRFPSDVSGRVTSIAIDEVNEDIFIGGAQGGVWRSSDNGASWVPLSDHLASTAVGAIAVVPPVIRGVGGDATVYLGTGESSSSCDSYAGVGVYRSTDSGNTWSGPFGGAQFANRSISWIAVDRTDSNHLMLTTASGIFGNSCVAAPTIPDRGVFESLDGGTTWTKLTAANRRFSMVIQDPVNADTWWAAGFTSAGSIEPANEGGLVKLVETAPSTYTITQVAGVGGLPALATTWGRSWITGTSDTDFPGESVLYLANALNLGPGTGAIFKSTDSGDTWTEIAAARAYCSAQCSYDMPIYVEPGNESVLYTGGAGASTVGVLPSQFMRSDNGGTSFLDKVRSADNTTAQHADVHSIVSWPGIPNRIWVGNDGGVWRSDDRGDNWVNVNTNLQLTQFSGCDLHPTNSEVIYAGSQDNGTQGREAGAINNAWKHLDFGDGGFARMDQNNPNNLVHTYFNQTNNLLGVGFTTGGFTTTMGFYLGSFAPGNGITISDRVLFYAPIHLDRGNSDTLYYGSNRLWRANDFFVTGGTGGEFVSPNPAQDLTGGSGAVSAIETFANPTPNTNATLLYTGSSSGRVFRSIDSGANWTEVDVAGSTLFVSDILVDPTNSNVVYQSRSGFSASAGLNVRKSIDGGNTWNPAATGIPNVPVNALAFDPVIAGRVWAGTDIGAYFTDNGGTTWTPHNSGLPTTAIFDLDSNPTTDTLVACTHGRGAFRLVMPLFEDGFESGNTSGWSASSP